MSNFPEEIKLKLENPIYEGSVQNLYDVPGHPDLLISETSAGGSVFDVGTIFNIEGSDIGRASFRHLVFQELGNADAWKTISLVQDETGQLDKLLDEYREKGAPTHHVGMVEKESGKVFPRGFPSNLSNLTLIRKFTIQKPELKKVLNWHFYDYKKYHLIGRNVVPLEFIVRLGITSGSSVLRKYDAMNDSGKKAYLNELGVDGLKPWHHFETPLVDLTTKYEPEDRNISRQEAALISGLDGDTFSRSLIMAVLGAQLLQQIFSRMGLNLWDMKWEIARDGDDLVFVDTIDTDSVRVTYNLEKNGKTYFVHFNKQAMRDYYKLMHADWLSAVNVSKKLAAQSGEAFTEILAKGQKKGTYPPNPDIDKIFLDIQKAKFEMIQSFVKNQSQDLSKEAEKIAVAEIEYYSAAGKLAEYEKLNAV